MRVLVAYGSKLGGVAGIALDSGHWHRDARRFLRRHERATELLVLDRIVAVAAAQRLRPSPASTRSRTSPATCG